MRDYPAMSDHVGETEPVPRRIRGYLNGQVVLDTTAATYVWDTVRYPAYHVPLDDVRPDLLVDEGRTRNTKQGRVAVHGLHVGDVERPGTVRVYGSDARPGVAGTVRVEWSALDAWFEEDEQVFVHPRNPYTRVDALRSTRHVRVELDGCLLAESSNPVLVFETGLPTRYYLERTAVDLTHMVPSSTVSECPYKGRTSAYWNVRTPSGELPDAAWSYDFPTRALTPIAGLVAFSNERVDLTVDGRRLERPVTPFS